MPPMQTVVPSIANPRIGVLDLALTGPSDGSVLLLRLGAVLIVLGGVLLAPRNGLVEKLRRRLA
jgi:hypothetical protein